MAFSFQGSAHVLGRYLGAGIANMLHFLFGRYPSWLWVIILFISGWHLIKKERPFSSFTQVLFIIFFLLVICTFLSVGILILPPQDFNSQIKGNLEIYRSMGGVVGVVSAVRLIYPIFNGHVWGARFILIVAAFFLLTVFTGIRIEALFNIVKIYLILSINIIARLGFGIYQIAINLLERGKRLDPERLDKLEKRKLIKTKLEEKRDTETKRLRRLDARSRLLKRQAEFIREKEGLTPVIGIPEPDSPFDIIPDEPAVPHRRGQAAHIQDIAGPGTLAGDMEDTESAAKKNKNRETATERFMGMVRNKKVRKELQEDISHKRIQKISNESADNGNIKKNIVTENTDIENKDTEAESAEEEIIYEEYEKPSIDILADPPNQESTPSQEKLMENSKKLEVKLGDFGIEGKIVAISPGPVITQYEVELAPGIRVSRIENLANDLAMAMAAKRIRIIAPIPGKSTVGIELPNEKPAIVYFKEVAGSDELLTQAQDEIKLVLGKTISGVNRYLNITRMPHQLIGGQTGSGKSVCINSLICSVLLTKTPDEVKFIMIDPKVVELKDYNGIPHLLSPVVSEPKEALRALKWTCIEMDKRYRLLARAGARNISSFNRKFENDELKDSELEPDDIKRMPYILIVIDELADLMMTASKEVEAQIARIAQISRAVGIHLILATQSPRTTVITGAIKANLPSRIAFQVAQMNDSRTILDQKGAEKLLGMGDMLFLPSGSPEIIRVHGTYISDEDIKIILKAVKAKKVKIERIDNFGFVDDDLDLDNIETQKSESSNNTLTDEKLVYEAAKIVVMHRMGSTSLLQRRLKVGYARAGRLMDELEEMGIVGPPLGSKAREVLVESREMVDAIFSEMSGE
ncbi:MAG: DNA translocase FtsK [bacterium]